MELTNLRYFYCVAQIEHITKASEKLHIAQPALSKSIKSLETELGVKLFYRIGRQIKLTDYGKFLKEKLKPILEELNSLQDEIENLANTNKNQICLNVLAASTVITNIITKFKQENPQVVFKISQQKNELNNNIIINTTSKDDVKKIKTDKFDIIEEEIFIAVPIDSEIAKKDEVDLTELKSQNFIALLGSKQFRPLCDTFCAMSGFHPKITFESDSVIAIKNLISAGIGIAFWPKFSWGEIDKKHIKLLKIKNPVCKREIVISQTQIEQSEIVKKFYNYLVLNLKTFAKE